LKWVRFSEIKREDVSYGVETFKYDERACSPVETRAQLELRWLRHSQAITEKTNLSEEIRNKHNCISVVN
jgi:hypothetical protein